MHAYLDNDTTEEKHLLVLKMAKRLKEKAKQHTMYTIKYG